MGYMAVAVSIIGIGIILIIAYVVIAQVKTLMPSESQLNDSNLTDSLESTQATVLAGFGLLAVSVIVLAAFAIIKTFK